MVIVWKINLTLPKICVKIFAYVTMDGKVRKIKRRSILFSKFFKIV